MGLAKCSKFEQRRPKESLRRSRFTRRAQRLTRLLSSSGNHNTENVEHFQPGWRSDTLFSSEVESLRARLCSAPSAKSRVLALMDHANVCLEPLAPHERTELTRVHGCASATFAKALFEEGNNGNISVRCIQGFSDSRLSKGILALLSTVLHGMTLSEIQSLHLGSLFDALCLRHIALSPRMGGANGILRHIETQMRVFLEQNRRLEHTQNSCGLHRQRELLEACASSSSLDAQAEIAVLLSGGVDSAVAMARLLEKGLRVQPFYLKIWLEDELVNLNSCPWEDDIRHAEQVCSTLSRRYNVKLQLEMLSLQDEYWNRVVRYTVDEAQAGRTPNPDVMCNSRIKFGAFLDSVGKSFQYVASGHYAQVRTETMTAANGEMLSVAHLLRSRDPVKDQTYFLSQLSQEQLLRAVFPIGDLMKREVRMLAREHFGLPNNDRPDSQGICFLGKLKFDQFLEHYLGTRAGSIVEAESGRVLGAHRGYWFYTVGQRRGLALPGGPWYVAGKDIENNLVFVSRNRSAYELDTSVFYVENVNWIGTKPKLSGTEKILCEVKIRHGPRTVKGELSRADFGGDSWAVRLLERESGIAPGQFAVFYIGNECIGGGVIVLASRELAFRSADQFAAGNSLY